MWTHTKLPSRLRLSLILMLITTLWTQEYRLPRSLQFVTRFMSQIIRSLRNQITSDILWDFRFILKFIFCLFNWHVDFYLIYFTRIIKKVTNSQLSEFTYLPTYLALSTHQSVSFNYNSSIKLVCFVSMYQTYFNFISSQSFYFLTQSFHDSKTNSHIPGWE